MSLSPDKYKVTISSSRSTIESMNIGNINNVPTDRFLSGLLGFPTLDAGILPPVVRSFDPTMRNFLVERLPFYASVSYKDCGASSQAERPAVYSIPIPWTVYNVTLDENYQPNFVQIWCRPEQLQSEEDELYYLPLPNLYQDGRTCLGAAEFGNVRVESIADGISVAVNAFWTSSFNRDLDYFIRGDSLRGIIAKTGDRSAQRNPINLFKTWSKMSIKDVLDTKFMPSLTPTVAQAMLNFNRSSNVPNDAFSLENILGFYARRR